MKTLRERNQESQYRTASQGLNHYNAILKAADYETRMDLESEITRLKADVKILSNLEMTITD